MVLLQPAREFLPVIDKVCVSLVHPGLFLLSPINYNHTVKLLLLQ